MFDKTLLPHVILVDSDMIIAAFGSRNEPCSLEVREFLQAMEDNNRRILIAAPSLAEILLGKDPGVLPRRRSIRVVPFDEQAAQVLAIRFDSPSLKAVARRCFKGLTGSRDYIKYDVMILACAIRHNAECILSGDEGVRKLCALVRYRCARLDDFKAPQMVLPLPVAAAGPASE